MEIYSVSSKPFSIYDEENKINVLLNLYLTCSWTVERYSARISYNHFNNKWLERKFTIVYLLEIQPKGTNFHRYSNEPVAFRWNLLPEWKFQDLITVLDIFVRLFWIPRNKNTFITFRNTSGLRHILKHANLCLSLVSTYHNVSLL